MNEYWGAFVGYLPDYWRSTSELAASFDARSKASRVVRALTADARGADRLGQAVVASALAVWLYEWGPLNEMVAAIVSLSFLASTASPFAAGVVGGLTYAGQQFLFGFVTVLAIGRMPSGLAAVRDVLNADTESGASIVDRFLLLVGVGTSALIVNEHARKAGRSLKCDLSLLTIAFAVLALVDIAVFWIAASAIEGVGSEELQDGIVSVATNPLTYVALFIGLKILGFYRRVSQAPPVGEWQSVPVDTLSSP